MIPYSAVSFSFRRVAHLRGLAWPGLHALLHLLLFCLELLELWPLGSCSALARGSGSLFSIFPCQFGKDGLSCWLTLGFPSRMRHFVHRAFVMGSIHSSFLFFGRSRGVDKEGFRRTSMKKRGGKEEEGKEGREIQETEWNCWVISATRVLHPHKYRFFFFST